MKRSLLLSLVPLAFLAAPITGFAAEQLIPAGSLIQCTVNEPKLSSKTTAIGDPILCQVSRSEVYGRAGIPYGSYLVGQFQDYKDPGHFYGKGWMELSFDRIVMQPNTVIPLSAKVVYVPNYPVDRDGRIRGKGHTTRDIVEWCIPVLWPIDVLTLPRRGPKPVLKAETRLTLKIMDDVTVPVPDQMPMYNPSPYGFSQRPPVSYAPPPPAPTYSAPYYAPQSYPQQPYQQPYQPANYGYAAAPPPVPMTVLVLRGGYRRIARQYWIEAEGVRYVEPNGVQLVVPMDSLDVPSTIAVNRSRGVLFAMRAAY